VAPVRVLIVDDQEPFRRAATAVVQLTEPFGVVGGVDSGEACLAAVPELRPDLVLMDVALPGMDGIETTRRLCLLPSPPVVVLVSTHEEDEFGDAARSCGAVTYIKKSLFGPDRLIAAWALRPSGRTARNSTASSPTSTSSS
jgi:DNA-binding NarL/FixJ family response regulator